jgi:hypothetical protein
LGLGDVPGSDDGADRVLEALSLVQGLLKFVVVSVETCVLR